MVRETSHSGDTQKVAILSIINSDPVARKTQYTSQVLTSSSRTKTARQYLHKSGHVLITWTLGKEPEAQSDKLSSLS